MKQHYDYIIVGAGCAGLSLLTRMIKSGEFNNKQILLIDKQPKNSNDRTWCFWEKENGFFEQIVHHQWNNLFVRNGDEHLQLNSERYVYKMIRGIDFYNYCFQIIKQQANIKVYFGEVNNIDAEKGVIKVGEDEFIANQIFSSVLFEKPQINKKQFYLLQHFRGWWIETKEDVFDSANADLMDFRTAQNNGCAFLYVLPISSKKALIEYTLFSENRLMDNDYNVGLQTFVTSKLKITNYKITEVENGVIPMTNMQFPKQKGKMLFIGTAGGQTKASTGYTFQFIQKQTAEIVKHLIGGDEILFKKNADRFNFYDGVLLRILSERKILGADVFFKMFKKNKASTVFKFLDNETNFLEELKLMASTDQFIFIPAAIKQLL